MAEDQLIHLVYNTGDQIWLTYVDGKQKVVKIITHDGLHWDTSMKTFGRIEETK